MKWSLRVLGWSLGLGVFWINHAQATQGGVPPVIAPGAPAFLVDMAKKHVFQPCAKSLPKGMVCIPGGIYIRGSQRNAQNSLWQMRAESPRHYVILDTFYIDKYEVTHADFKKCLDAGYCKPSAFRLYPGHWRYSRFGTPNRPFVSATWFHANDYCRFVGKRLLTEAEWEAAARGLRGTTYPWGNSPPDCRKANYRFEPSTGAYPRLSLMKFCPHPSEGADTYRKGNQDQTWDVGSTPPYHGIYDMAGNGYEWVQDVYDPHAYAGCDVPGSPECTWMNPHGACPMGRVSCSVKKKALWVWRRVPVDSGDAPPRRRRRVRRRLQWKRVLVRLRRPRMMTYTQHILKGGSWWWYADRMRSAHRRASHAATGMHRLSIRCGSHSPTFTPLPPKPKAAPERRPRRRKRRRVKRPN